MRQVRIHFRGKPRPVIRPVECCAIVDFTDCELKDLASFVKEAGSEKLVVNASQIESIEFFSGRDTRYENDQ